jgi:hypothetical protein
VPALGERAHRRLARGRRGGDERGVAEDVPDVAFDGETELVVVAVLAESGVRARPAAIERARGALDPAPEGWNQPVADAADGNVNSVVSITSVGDPCRR